RRELPRERFRALALFGRRSPERVVRSSLPASENLHKTGLMHRSKQYLYSITSSARVSTVAGTSRPSALAVLRFSTVSYFRRRLHRQVGRLLALEGAIRAAVQIGE